MKIATKMVLASTLLCTLAVVATGIIVGWRSSDLSESALYQRANSQLISVREIKKNEIENYFNQIAGQVVTTANAVGVQDAITLFSNAFASYPIESVSESDLGKLRDYYQSSFGAKYRQSNSGQSAGELEKLNSLDATSRAIQARYIGTNPNPLGEKHQLMSDSLGTEYDKVHSIYHPSFKGFLEQFGYYDIFLVDMQGLVVYSVFKELDYATNLKKGPYANSGLAKAYNQALNLSANQYYLDDFAPYFPSYEAAASFIATPIKRNGETLGVLIFQMPVDEINRIMTFGGSWSYAGLGESGETYLVGQDGLLRSESRFFLESPDGYFSALEAAGVSAQVINQIDAKSSAIGRQPVSTSTSKLALRGQSGSESILDYRGVEVLSAYAPIKAAGLSWGIITEIDRDEALQDITTLNKAVVITVISSIFVVVTISMIISYFLGSSIAKPIRLASQKIQHISANNDLTQRLTVEGKDEMTDLAVSLNGLFTHLQDIIGKFAQVTNNLNDNTQSMAGNMNNTRSSVADQNARTETVATAVNQMSASIAEVAQFANRAAEFVKQANETGSEGVLVGQSLGDEISRLDAEMQTAVAAIDRLNNETNSIAEVLDVIQGIAEQTNLLALNAAIEAARAGEQGRGFAVVADEVRSLAGRTQASTEEIRGKIESLQRETNGVSSSIQNANATVSQGVTTCDRNTHMLEQIVNMLNELNEMNVQIAAATEEQRAVTDEISGSITSIADASASVSVQVQDADEVLQGISSEAEQLNSEVSQFKY
ncbi:methyl-accepting chemotaxis protein [Vibrio sp. TRT 1302]|uniref:methyl-accepting chemotaxis protein n=1 Tax=Vibrio sp. TRT 1302 TaxID=3418504 RepID=UPI003CF1F535